MTKVILMSAMVFSLAMPTWATEVKGHKFPDTVKVGDKELVRNGAGLRQVVRFGLTFNVYVAGLYLEKKSSDANAIIKSDEVKHFKSYYLRQVEVKDQRDPWRESIEKNCFSNCSESKKKIMEFISHLKRTKEGGQFDFTFYPDRVEFKMESSSGPVSVVIQSAHFSKDLLAVFIGKSPPTEELKKSLLTGG